MNPVERNYLGDYIRGQFVTIKDPNGEFPSINPGNREIEEVKVPFSYEHVHDAVVAAKRAFQSWKRLTVQDRIKALNRYQECLVAKKTALARMLSFEVGKPLWESEAEMDEAIRLIVEFIKLGSQTSAEMRVENAAEGATGTVRFYSRGALAVIAPATQAVFQAHAHMIPALMNGNTVVLKVSEHTPFTGQLIAQIVHESGIPGGVVNLLQGNAEIEQRLIVDPELDGVLYTGNYETAEKMRKHLLSDFWKLQIYETGGKNAVVLWGDCNYEKALRETLLSAFITSGQRSTNGSRIFVHEKIFDKFLSHFHAAAKKINVDYAFKEGAEQPFMGPLITEAAQEEYLRFQGIAVREGAEEIMRGKVLEKPHKGFYVSPSIHLVNTPEAKSIYQKSEIHGPNVFLCKVKDLDETAEWMNQSQYGLVASVYSAEKDTFLRIGEELRVGILHWNRPTTHVSYRLPYGGMKRSGNSRMMGSFAGNQLTYPMSLVEAEPTSQLEGIPKALPVLDLK